MKKIISFALSLVLIFSLAACGKKNSDIETVKDYGSQQTSRDSESGQKTVLNLIDVGGFINGYAWVLTSDTECSLIDTSGKIIYIYDSSSWIDESDEDSGVHHMSNDACYIKEKVDDNKYVYKINKSGKVVASSADGKFDEILAAGDNLFFVHKYESGIGVSRHLYGTLNEKGKFVNQLRECPYGTPEEAYYIGGKAFEIFTITRPDDPLIYMSSINKYISGGGRWNSPGYLSNIGDTLYVRNYNHVIQVEGSDTQYNESHGYKYVAISPDGKIEKVPDFDYVMSGMLVKSDFYNSQSYVSLTDPATGKTSVFSKYDYNVCEIHSADNNFLLSLQGIDFNDYYTVIDKNCNMLFEPVMGSEATANDGRVVFRTDEGYSVLDYTGKVIIPVGTYSHIDSFYSGIAWAKNSSNQYVGIDVNGKVVIS